jgi:hypothetical protein
MLFLSILEKNMSRVGWKPHAAYILFLYIALAMAVLSACDDSTSANGSTTSSPNSASKNAYPESFKPNDKEYPYANIPRIVIYTENSQKVKSRKTEIPAKLQIWGEKEPESEILDLTIRGRGNSSWSSMPKKSYKIEFVKKQSLLGMPKDRDWALIANYADKTLMRNFIAYRLSAALGAYYAPRCEFAELYLNGEYCGVYLLTETIKIGKNRVDIPKNDYSYIVEVDGKYGDNEQIVFSDVLMTGDKKKPFRIHDPKNATVQILDTIQNFIRKFENHLLTFDTGKDNDFESWIDVNESVKHYWVQEFTKNPDAEFYTSVYFSWVKDEKIKMGPVWDFDLAFGNHINEKVNSAEGWYMRKYWYFYLYRDLMYKEKLRECWFENEILFERVLDSIEVCRKTIKKAAQNNFKRWDILNLVDDSFFRKSYSSYKDAVVGLKEWVSQRFQWINRQYEEK